MVLLEQRAPTSMGSAVTLRVMPRAMRHIRAHILSFPSLIVALKIHLLRLRFLIRFHPRLPLLIRFHHRLRLIAAPHKLLLQLLPLPLAKPLNRLIHLSYSSRLNRLNHPNRPNCLNHHSRRSRSNRPNHLNRHLYQFQTRTTRREEQWPRKVYFFKIIITL